MKQRLLYSLFLIFPRFLFAQEHIDNIKNQEYLKMAKNVDCNNVNDNLSQRICANLAFQRSDSLLTIVYDNLLQIATERNAKTMKEKIVALQKTWRKLRDQHCTIIYDQYKNCGGCHQQAIAYLNCLRELTDSRIIELEKLKEELN